MFILCHYSIGEVGFVGLGVWTILDLLDFGVGPMYGPPGCFLGFFGVGDVCLLVCFGCRVVVR